MMRWVVVGMVLCVLVACSRNPDQAKAAKAVSKPDAAVGAAPAPEPQGPAAANPVAAGSDWLHRTWELTYDPQNDPTDWMVFEAGGKAVLKTPTGREYEGSYQVEGERVLLAFVVKEKAVNIPLIVSPSRDRLTNSAGAYYTRKQ